MCVCVLGVGGGGGGATLSKLFCLPFEKERTLKGNNFVIPKGQSKNYLPGRN